MFPACHKGPCALSQMDSFQKFSREGKMGTKDKQQKANKYLLTHVFNIQGKTQNEQRYMAGKLQKNINA